MRSFALFHPRRVRTLARNARYLVLALAVCLAQQGALVHAVSHLHEFIGSARRARRRLSLTPERPPMSSAWNASPSRRSRRPFRGIRWSRRIRNRSPLRLAGPVDRPSTQLPYFSSPGPRLASSDRSRTAAPSRFRHNRQRSCSMSSPSSGAVAMAIALVFAACPAAAQSPRASPESPAAAGSVVVAAVLKDGTGNPLPGVAVRLRDTGGSVVGTAVSDSAGNLQFPSLTPGTYTFDADGFVLNDETRTVVVTAPARRASHWSAPARPPHHRACGRPTAQPGAAESRRTSAPTSLSSRGPTFRICRRATTRR